MKRTGAGCQTPTVRQSGGNYSVPRVDSGRDKRRRRGGAGGIRAAIEDGSFHPTYERLEDSREGGMESTAAPRRVHVMGDR